MPEPSSCQIHTSRTAPDELLVHLEGEWTIRQKIPSADLVLGELDGRNPVTRVAFDSENVRAWDSRILPFLVRIHDRCRAAQIEMEEAGLPPGVVKLLNLATAVPEKKGTGKVTVPTSFLNRIGEQVLRAPPAALEMLRFLGESVLGLARWSVGRAQYRRIDLIQTIQQCGADALPIVSLISFLVGLILALVGAVQLQMFAAEIYTANLVALAMVREMGCIMTGIIMAGRTGAAFAAQLGTMTVNEEIDALRTLGIPPIDFLVLPRMLALMLMLPLLCLYSDLLGILGGAVVGVTLLDLNFAQYYGQTVDAVTLTDCAVGVVKAVIFGALVAISGCLRGMQSGRSASAVGIAATSAVVTSIVLIIVVDAVGTVVCNVLGI